MELSLCVFVNFTVLGLQCWFVLYATLLMWGEWAALLLCSWRNGNGCVYLGTQLTCVLMSATYSHIPW
jgi:hypothetical protein